MRLDVEVLDMGGLQGLASLLAPGKPGYGEVVVRLLIGEEEEPLMRLGRDFALNGELVEQLAQVPGLAKVSLRPVTGGSRLRLVA